MGASVNKKRELNVISVLQARENFGKLLDRVNLEQRSVVIEKRGSPKAVLLSIRDYIRLAAPEPEILRVIGDAAKLNGTDKLTSQEIDDEIKKYRAERKRR